MSNFKKVSSVAGSLLWNYANNTATPQAHRSSQGKINDVCSKTHFLAARAQRICRKGNSKDEKNRLHNDINPLPAPSARSAAARGLLRQLHCSGGPLVFNNCPHLSPTAPLLQNTHQHARCTDAHPRLASWLSLQEAQQSVAIREFDFSSLLAENSSQFPIGSRRIPQDGGKSFVPQHVVTVTGA